MKKLILIAITVIVMAWSCQRDPITPKPNPDPNEQEMVTFHVSIPNPGLKTDTRFSSGGGMSELDPSQYQLRMTMQAWQGDSLLVQTFSERVSITQSVIAFDATLPTGTYNLLFWADFAGISPDTTFYDVTSLQAVLRKNGTYANGYQYDAYFGAVTAQTITSDYTFPGATLSRPFGRLEITDPNWQTTGATTVTVTYITSIPQGFNVLQGDVTKDVMTPGFTTNLVPVTTGSAQELAFDYIFAAINNTTTVSVVVSCPPAVGYTPIMNIPIIVQQRSSVSAHIGNNAFTASVSGTSTCVQNSTGGYDVSIFNSWTTNLPTAATIKLVATNNGYCLPVSQALTSNNINGDTVTVASPLLAPNTQYTIQLLDNNNRVIAVGNVTSAPIPTSNVNVITVGQGEWRPDLSLKITQPGTYYIMPGEYQISAQDLTINGSLSLIGNDPTQVQIYYAVHPVSVYGNNVNLQFIDMHITTNSTNVVELQTAQNYSISNILFQNCIVNLNQYGGTDATMVSAQNTNSAYTSTINTYTINNCIIYGQGSQSNANLFQGAVGGNATVQINNINVSNSTIVDTGGGFISLKSASGVDFPYTISFAGITAYNILNWSSAWNPMSLFEVTTTGPSTKTLNLAGTIFYLGSLIASNPSYARWFNFSTATGGYPTINTNTTNSPVLWFNSQPINYGSGTPPYSSGNPVYYLPLTSVVDYTNTPPTSMWINPTNNPATFNFGILDPTLLAAIKGGYVLGDPRWNSSSN